jgi:hypothetical protein
MFQLVLSVRLWLAFLFDVLSKESINVCDSTHGRRLFSARRPHRAHIM